MLRNQIRFAIRLFIKDGAYSVLNILGLSLGIGVGIILLLYLQYDLSYDRHHEKHRNIYRLTHYLMAQGADFNTSRTARELAPILKEELPEILEYVRFGTWNGVTLTYEKDGERRQFIEDDIVVADSTIFKVFTHPFLAGNPRTALAGPNKIVLSNSIATKFFSDGEAVGEFLTIDGIPREVTGVMEDMPRNSHLYYNIIVSGMEERGWVRRMREEGNAEAVSEGFWNPNSYTYLLLPDDYDHEAFDEKFQATLFEKTFGLFAKRIEGSVRTRLQPLAEIHFQADMQGDEPQGDIAYLYTFTSIGIFIILLACINYMNLATARSVVRTSEIAIKKVMGSNRRKLFASVMFESLLMAIMALVLAIGLVYVLLYVTPFPDLIGKQLELNFFQNSGLLVGTLLVTVAIGLISGIYPAIYIPAIPVVTGLKGARGNSGGAAWLRKSMIVFQFVISLFVIICTFLMDRQLEFVQNTELGFSNENIVLIDVPDTTVENRMEAIKTAMLSNPKILSASTSWGVPGVRVGGQVFWVEKEGEMAQQSMNALWVSKEYLKTMGIELLEGRTWLDDSPAERLSFLINEKGAEELGWKDDALGKRARYFHGEEDAHIVGVLKDFNFENLHNEIEPLFIMLAERPGGTFNIRVRPEELRQTMAFIEETWTQFSPNHPYEYQFLDAEFDRQYREDETQKTLISSLSYISIFISLLGLVGLSAFTAGQKIKEIGVRKTLGATVPGILLMFSKSYFRLIVIAFIIAVPLANYLITEWLNEFAYRLTIQWWYFGLPGVLVVILGLTAVVIQSVKAARANPAEALRTE